MQEFIWLRVCLAVNQENDWTYRVDLSHRDGPNKTQMYIPF